METSEIQDLAGRIRTEVAKAVIGQRDTVDLMLTALFSAGHILLEGPPGTAKTLLTQCFAAAIDLDERLRSSDSLDVPEELRLRALVRG